MKRRKVIEPPSHAYVSETAKMNTGLILAFSNTSRQDLTDSLSWNPRIFQVTPPNLPDITTLMIY